MTVASRDSQDVPGTEKSDKTETMKAVQGDAADLPPTEPVRCSSLRTKAMYLPPNEHADGRTLGGSATAVFWCLKTMKMTGPDDGFVARSVCRPDRSCYTPGD